MDRQADVEFLEQLRKKIDDYLFLGHAPSGNEDYNRMQEALKEPRFQELRRSINEMKSRAHRLFSECGVKYIVTQYPTPAIGGPKLRFDLLDLVTNNRTSSYQSKQDFFDAIDEAIGALKNQSISVARSSPDSGNSRSSMIRGFVFIAMPMSPEDPSLVDVHDAIKEVAEQLDLRAERIDDPPTNESISLRIIKLLETAQFVVADLTDAKPNVYFEAGYAAALDKTPIYIAREGTKPEFDVQDYPVIFFKNIAELKKRLNDRLKALKDNAS